MLVKIMSILHHWDCAHRKQLTKLYNFNVFSKHKWQQLYKIKQHLPIWTFWRVFSVLAGCYDCNNRTQSENWYNLLFCCVFYTHSGWSRTKGSLYNACNHIRKKNEEENCRRKMKNGTAYKRIPLNSYQNKVQGSDRH